MWDACSDSGISKATAHRGRASLVRVQDDPDCETVALNAIDAHEERSALGDVFVTLCDAMSAEVPQSLLCLGPSHSSGGANDGGCSDGTAAMDEDSAGNGALDGDSDDDPSHSSDAFDMAERDDTATTVGSARPLLCTILPFTASSGM